MDVHRELQKVESFLRLTFSVADCCKYGERFSNVWVPLTQHRSLTYQSAFCNHQCIFIFPENCQKLALSTLRGCYLRMIIGKCLQTNIKALFNVFPEALRPLALLNSRLTEPALCIWQPRDDVCSKLLKLGQDYPDRKTELEQAKDNSQ